VISPELEAVRKYLRSQMNDLADYLASKKARNMEDYCYTCGVIRGCAEAESYVLDLDKKLEEAQSE